MYEYSYIYENNNKYSSTEKGGHELEGKRGRYMGGFGERKKEGINVIIKLQSQNKQTSKIFKEKLTYRILKMKSYAASNGRI